MISRDDFIAHEAGTLGKEELERFEAALACDEPSLRWWLAQRQMDEILRVLHGTAESRSRIRHSIMEVVSGTGRADMKHHIMRSVVVPQTKRRMLLALSTLTAAAACVSLMLWLTPAPGIATVVAAVNLTVERAGVTQQAAPGLTLRADDTLIVADTPQAGAAIEYRDATRLEFSARSHVILSLDGKGGKHVDFTHGSLTARVSKQPPRAPLIIVTPQATLTVIGTEFMLAAAADKTQLQVNEGLVRMARHDGGEAVEVAAGESMVFMPNTIHPPAPKPGDTLGQGLNAATGRRRAFLWPFAADSIWNQAIGSSARYEPVQSPGFDAHAVLTNVITGRPIFMEVSNFPVHRVLVDGRVLHQVRFPDKPQPGFAADWPVIVIVDPFSGNVTELSGTDRQPSGDLTAKVFSKSALRGAGDKGLTASGLSAFGGVIRFGELTRGIPHALAIGVRKEWIAGNLQLGGWLAIPPSADIASFHGPAFELARALQDYGACITDTGAGPVTFFAWYENVPPDFAASVGKLLPLLRVVKNRTAGDPRRPSAPPLENDER